MTEKNNVELWTEELRQKENKIKERKEGGFMGKATFVLSLIGSISGVAALALILFGFGGQGDNMGNRPDFENNNGTMTQPQNPNNMNNGSTTTTTTGQ